MARVLIGLFPAWSHLVPLVAVAQRLQARGHVVAFACHPTLAAPLERAGLERLDGFRWGDRAVRALERQRAPMSVLGRLRRAVGRQIAPPMLHDLERGAADLRTQLRTWEPDLLVSDLMFHPGPIAAELEDLPWATSCPHALVLRDGDPRPRVSGREQDASPGWRGPLSGGLRRAFRARRDFIVNRARRALGLPAAPQPFVAGSPYLVIAYHTAMLEYEDPTLPRQVHLVGPSIAERRGDEAIPFPWGWLDGRPLVSLSLGSIFIGDPSFYERAAEASRGQAWQMVLKVGPHQDPARMRDVPENVLIVHEQPQLALLGRARAMIQHAGLNSCVEALAAGVPLVLAPREADQGAIAARVVRTGAALCIDRTRSGVAEIRAAIRRVLEEDAFRAAARRVAQDFARCDGPRAAVGLLERLIATRRPLLRPPGAGATVYATDLVDATGTSSS